MSKLSRVLFSIIAAGVFTSLSAMTTNAQRANPSAQETQQWRQRGPCRDPWVSKAVTEYKGSVAGQGDYGECVTRMYNGGSWNSYDQLYQGVKTAFDNMRGYVTITKILNNNGTVKIVTNVTGFAPHTDLVSHDGSSLISQDGSTIKIILNGGGNIVSQGAGNFKTLSTSTEKRINLGKSVLVATKN